MQSVTKLQCALELFCKYHPRAFKILTGENPPPTVKEVSEMLHVAIPKTEIEAIQTSTITREAESMMILSEKFLSVIDQAGGWSHITRIVNEFREISPRNWSIFVDHSLWVDAPLDKAGSRLGGSCLEKLGNKYGVAPGTVTRISKTVPRMIARSVSKTYKAQAEYSW